MQYSTKHKLYQQYGFSMIELTVTITVIVIIASISIANFAELIARSKVTTQTNAVFESLYVARSTAITQQKIVQVCHMSEANSLQCHQQRDFNSAWSNGWLVFADVNDNNEYDDDDNLVRVYQASAQANIVFNQQGRLRFFPDGSARSAGFYICDKQHQSYRHVYLLHSGRARINHSITAKQKSHCDNA